MDVLRSLLDEIKQLQLLVCLHRQKRSDTQQRFSLHEVSSELHISPEECGQVARRLIDMGWVEPVAETTLPTEQQLRLTSEGITQLHSWAGESRGGGKRRQVM